MLELLAPAGSPEAVVAAVQNGADAVYFGFDTLNARRNAANFTEEDVEKTMRYCHIRGAKAYIALNILATDRELLQAEELARRASRLGADALIVQDLGVLQAVKQAVPGLPVHASTQMSIHNLDGVRRAAEMGADRVILARELSKAHIAYICKHAPVKIEVFAHGALCMSYSGQCYMSAAIGARSGNRGLCAQPCRLGYSLDGVNGHPLSLRDLSLIHHVQALEACGVSCLKIEGRMKRPEYTAIVTRIYAAALKERRGPTEEEERLLAAAFSRQGFTDAYFQRNKGPHMHGVREESNKQPPALFDQIRDEYLNTERPLVPLRFYALLRRGAPARIAAEDDKGNRAQTEGPVPEPALHRETTRVDVQTQLYKTGGTPYRCEEAKIAIDGGLNLPLSAINQMRRALIEQLTCLRVRLPERETGRFDPGIRHLNGAEPPRITLSLRKAAQLTPELAAMGAARIYIPMEELAREAKALRPYLERKEPPVAVVLPRIVTDSERDDTLRILEAVHALGVEEALVGNLGHIALAMRAGFSLRGDFGMNLFNSQSLKLLAQYQFLSATLSFELNYPQIRDISKSIDTELIVYGRLPLMLTENCLIKNVKGRCACDTVPVLHDRKGAAFPVLSETGCRNVVLNSRKLFLADKAEDYASLGLWAVRLMFTTENAVECRQVMERYLQMGYYEPGDYTRGLYYRGVE